VPQLGLLFHGESLEVRKREKNTVYLIHLRAGPPAASEPSLYPGTERFHRLSRGLEAVMDGRRPLLQSVAETAEQSLDIIPCRCDGRAIGSNSVEPNPEFLELH